TPAPSRAERPSARKQSSGRLPMRQPPALMFHHRKRREHSRSSGPKQRNATPPAAHRPQSLPKCPHPSAHRARITPHPPPVTRSEERIQFPPLTSTGDVLSSHGSGLIATRPPFRHTPKCRCGDVPLALPVLPTRPI